MTAKKRNKTILSIASTIVICMAGAITSFAYEAPNTLIVNSPNEFLLDSEFLEEKENTDKNSSAKYFIDITGIISEVKEPNSSEKALCKHNFSIEGTYRTHKKNSDGGCTVTDYDAVKCSLCGSVKVGDLVSTTTYVKCPH